MSLSECSVAVLHTPFEASGIVVHEVGETTKGERPLLNTSLPSFHPTVGVKGLRLLAVNQRRNSTISAALTGLKSIDISSVALRFFTKHKKGELFVWDGLTSELIGSCSHGFSNVVDQCVISDDYIFTTVIDTTTGAARETEAFYEIYQWDAKTLALNRTLTLKSRVEALAIYRKTCLVVAMESGIEIWSIENKGSRNVILSIPIGAVKGCRNAPKCIAVSGNLLLVGSSSQQLSVYSLTSGALLAYSIVDSSEAATALCLATSALSSPGKANKVLTVITGSDDGKLSTFVIPNLSEGAPVSPKKLIPNETQKLFRTSIVKIIADDDVIVILDDFTGAVLKHRREKLATNLTKLPSRAVMLDSSNKRLVMGDDSGVLTVFSYAKYAAHCEKLEVLFTYRPHTGSIMGIYLQVGNGNIWERMTTCSVDGSVITLDFSDDKALAHFNQQRTAPDLNTLVAVDDDTVVVADPSTHCINFFTSCFEPNDRFPEFSLRDSSVALVSLVGNMLLVVTSKNVLQNYSLVTNEQDNRPMWRENAPWSFTHSMSPVSATITAVDVAPDRTVAVVGSFVTSTEQLGYITLLRPLDNKLVILGQSIMNLLPVSATVLSSNFSAFNASFTCCVAVENAGMSIQVHYLDEKADGGYSLFGRVTAAKPSLPYSSSQGGSQRYQTKTFFCTLPSIRTSSSPSKSDENSESPGDRLAYVEGGEVFLVDVIKASFDITPRVAFLMERRGKEDSLIQHSFHKVIGFCVTPFGGFRGVVIRQKSSVAQVVVETGAAVAYELTYDGDVVPTEPSSRRKPITFPTKFKSHNDFPFCSCVVGHTEGRYVCVGYENGVIQVFDLCERRLLTRWFTPHEGGTMQLRALASSILVTSKDHPFISVYEIPRRFVFDDTNKVENSYSNLFAS